MHRISWLLLIALFVSGCSDTSQQGASGTPDTTGTVDKGDGKSKPDPEKPKPTLADLPADLKHAGFEYYGLGRGKPIHFISKVPGRPDQTGTLEYKISELSDGKAIFEQDFSGEIEADLKDSKLVLQSSGVYSTTLGDTVLDVPQLELPNEVTAGKAWSIDKPFKAGPATFNKFASKIVAMEKVTVPMGTFDAAKVVANVEMDQGGVKQNATMTAWYVKGIGTVKLSMVVTAGKEKAERTMLATK